MRYILTLLCVLLTICSTNVFAAADVTAADKRMVEQALEKLSTTVGRPFTATDIKPSPVSCMLQVTSGLNIFYISRDGKFLLSGDLVDLSKDQRTWNLNENALRKLRRKAIAAVNVKDMIIFPASKKRISTVTVFVDIDCGYCQKLQADMQQYNDLGIEMRYLAFPRGGLDSSSYEKAVTVWCSDDRRRDIALIMQGKDLAKNMCKDNPVKSEVELGIMLGVTGTPTMFLENGARIPGLLGPEDLLKVIKEEGK